MVTQIFNIVFPIFAIVLVGYFYGRRHMPDMAAANKLNIEIFVPALIFDLISMSINSLRWAEQQLFSVPACWPGLLHAC
jgi:predicted permease